VRFHSDSFPKTDHMAKTFTPDFLLQYTYGELSEKESLEVEALCNHDLYLRDELALINESKSMLDEVELKPSDKTLNYILSFSKAYHVSELESGDQVEMILN